MSSTKGSLVFGIGRENYSYAIITNAHMVDFFLVGCGLSSGWDFSVLNFCVSYFILFYFNFFVIFVYFYGRNAKFFLTVGTLAITYWITYVNISKKKLFLYILIL